MLYHFKHSECFMTIIIHYKAFKCQYLLHLFCIAQVKHIQGQLLYSVFIFIQIVFIIFSIQIVVLFFQYLCIIVSIFLDLLSCYYLLPCIALLPTNFSQGRPVKEHLILSYDCWSVTIFAGISFKIFNVATLYNYNYNAS